jgi:hypothetical protein
MAHPPRDRGRRARAGGDLPGGRRHPGPAGLRAAIRGSPAVPTAPHPGGGAPGHGAAGGLRQRALGGPPERGLPDLRAGAPGVPGARPGDRPALHADRAGPAGLGVLDGRGALGHGVLLPLVHAAGDRVVQRLQGPARRHHALRPMADHPGRTRPHPLPAGRARRRSAEVADPPLTTQEELEAESLREEELWNEQAAAALVERGSSI